MSSLRSATAWNYFGQITFVVVNFVGSLILARLLTPAEFGIYAIANAAVLIVQAFQNFGLGNLLVTAELPGPDRQKSVFTGFVLQAALTAAILAALAYPVALSYGEPSMVAVLLVLALAQVAVPFQSMADALLFRELRFKALALVQITRALTNTGVTVALALAGFSALSFALGLLASMLISAVLVSACAWRQMTLGFSLSHWRELVNFGGFTALWSALDQVALRLPELVIGQFYGMAAVGLYSRAFGLIEMVRGLLLDPILRMLLPLFTRLNDEGQPMGSLYKTVVESVTGVGWAAFLGLALTAEPVIHLLFGPRWLEAVPLLQTLCAVFATAILLPHVIAFLIVVRQMQRATVLQLANLTCIAALVIVGALFSLQTTVELRILAAVGTVLIYMHAATQIGRFTMQSLLGGYVRSLLSATLGVGVPVMAWKLFDAGFATASVGHLALIVLSGVLGWMLALLATRHRLGQEGLALLATLRSRLAALRA